ncbi:MAG: hypothetical protein HY547_09090 [Elusimicrobia bacterium]|nr:hypothetical protein [Elusimicrobiota bacterium]
MPALGSSAPVYNLESGVRLSSATPHSILEIAGGWRLYFTRDNLKVLTATSTDGLAWSEETGFRISTETARLDASSITSCAVLPISSTYYRMIYSAVSSTKTYHLLSATSTDGLTWGKESATRYEAGSSSTFVGAVRLSSTTAGIWRLYFLQDENGDNDASDYGLFTATSTDYGVTWSSPTQIIAARFGAFAAGRLTNDKIRLMYTIPLTDGTTDTELAGVISSDELSFTGESPPQVSTGALDAFLASPVLHKVNSFQWRLYYGVQNYVSTHPFVYSAVTSSINVQGIDPATGFNDEPARTFNLYGEIFSTGTYAITLTKSGESPIAATSVNRQSDMSATGTFDLLFKTEGKWDLVVTNSAGQSQTMISGFTLTAADGRLTITDNLFKPLQSGRSKLDLITYKAGNIRIKIYTINGEPVKTIFDEYRAPGAITQYWNGDTDSGQRVASGLYILETLAPNTERLDKIIVVK